MKVIGYITTTVVFSIYAVILNGWALSKLWLWFIVQTFDVPSLSVPAAIGVALIVSYLTTRTNTEKEEKKEFAVMLAEGFFNATFRPLLCVGMGAIVRVWL